MVILTVTVGVVLPLLLTVSAFAALTVRELEKELRIARPLSHQWGVR
jgi:hypothetical protein